MLFKGFSIILCDIDISIFFVTSNLLQLIIDV